MTTSERIAGRTMAPPRRTLPCYLIAGGGKNCPVDCNLWPRVILAEQIFKLQAQLKSTAFTRTHTRLLAAHTAKPPESGANRRLCLVAPNDIANGKKNLSSGLSNRSWK